MIHDQFLHLEPQRLVPGTGVVEEARPIARLDVRRRDWSLPRRGGRAARLKPAGATASSDHSEGVANLLFDCIDERKAALVTINDKSAAT
jgi:hypothetical protein